MVLKALDILLFAIHMLVIVGNVFGWIWRRTRKAHLVLLVLTLGSWFVLGIWKGWGYCILTDWEWDIKRELGETNLPQSFTAYLANNVLGLKLSNALVDGLTVGGLIFGLIGAIVVNWNQLPFNARKKA